MKKILVAVDGSTPSIHAAKKACELAAGMGAQVDVIHVALPTIVPGEVPFIPPQSLRDADMARANAILAEVASKLPMKPGKMHALLGAPAEAVADVATAEGYDLVVVGNTGRGAVSRVLLGSVADRLVHICKVPVLVVR